MNDPLEVLSAWLDGEHVDIDSLVNVLETVEGREALGDFLRMRQLVTAGDADPDSTCVARVRARVGARRSVLFRLALPAAAVLALAFVSGWWAGMHRDAAGRAGSASPPAVARTLTFERDIDWDVVR